MADRAGGREINIAIAWIECLFFWFFWGRKFLLILIAIKIAQLLEIFCVVPILRMQELYKKLNDQYRGLVADSEFPNKNYFWRVSGRGLNIGIVTAMIFTSLSRQVKKLKLKK